MSMEVLNALKRAVTACADVVKWGSGLQESTRKGLVADLQTICGNCDAAYDTVLTRLMPAQHVIQDFETDLRSAQTAMRDAKTQTIGLI